MQRLAAVFEHSEQHAVNEANVLRLERVSEIARLAWRTEPVWNIAAKFFRLALLW